MKTKLCKKAPLLFIAVQLGAAFLLMHLLPCPQNGPAGFFLALGVYLFVLVLPVTVFVRVYLKENPACYLLLCEQVGKGVAMGASAGLFVVLLFYGKHLLSGAHAGMPTLLPVLEKALAGPLEELPFRGFYLRLLAERWGFWRANLTVSCLFALMHFTGVQPQAMASLLLIFVVSLWLGYLYKAAHSLWASVITHSVYNVMTVIFG